jgi:phosphoribosylanthranilate isomerase
MKNPRLAIKICGIRCSDTAYDTACAGAQYIGIMLHPHSKRYVVPTTAALIAEATRQGGAIPVAVCVDHDAQQMNELCHQLNIDTVQLHGENARQQHHHLDQHIKRIYVLHVDASGNAVNHHDNAIQYLKSDRDLLLFDGLVGGSGQSIPLHNIPVLAGDFQYFIAGGLNHQNVQDIKMHCKPYGLDVSSGVENNKGLKDKHRIRQFIATVQALTS